MAEPGVIIEEGFWSDEWGHYWTFGEADCAYTLMEYLPVGLMWPRDNDTYLFRVMNAVGTEVCALMASVKSLSYESQLSHINYMLTEWEQFLWLPEPCFTPANTEEKKSAVKSKFLSLFYKNAAEPFFEKLAESFGFTFVSKTQNGLGMQIGDPIGSQVGPNYINFSYTYTFSGVGNKAALECMFKNYLPMVHADLATFEYI